MRTIDPVTGQVLNVTFAEPETLTKIRAARARVTAARADLEKAARKLSLVHRNSDALELQGKNTEPPQLTQSNRCSKQHRTNSPGGRL